MTAAAYQDEIRGLVAKLEQSEKARAGSSGIARERLASKIGAAPGTLENIRRGRLKRIDAWLRDRIVALLIRQTEFEIRTLEHELEIYRRMGERPDSAAFSQVETDLAAHRLTIEKWKGSVS